MRSPPTEASTTAMALAMAAALKKRKADMELNTAHRAWFSVGQVSMIVTVEPNHPLIGNGSFHIKDFAENEDGSLLIYIDRVTDHGICFTNSQSRPNEYTMSQAFSQKHEFFDKLKDLPQFGKTEVIMTVSDNLSRVVLHVPAERRKLMNRRLKRERSQALSEAIQSTVHRHTEDEFRAALKVVNEYRDQQSGNVKFRINEEGQVKATLVVEY